MRLLQTTVGTVLMLLRGGSLLSCGGFGGDVVASGCLIVQMDLLLLLRMVVCGSATGGV